MSEPVLEETLGETPDDEHVPESDALPQGGESAPEPKPSSALLPAGSKACIVTLTPERELCYNFIGFEHSYEMHGFVDLYVVPAKIKQALLQEEQNRGIQAQQAAEALRRGKGYK